MMNQRLQSFARTEIFNDLLKCTSKQRRLFVIMYLGQEQNSIPRDVKEEISDEDLKIAISQIREHQLSWAMEQTRRTVMINEEKKDEPNH